MVTASGTISRGGFIEWLRRVNSSMEYLRTNTYGEKYLYVNRAVINNKEEKPGLVKSENIPEFINMLVTKQKYNINFELGVKVVDTIKVWSLIFGEHEEKVSSSLRFYVTVNVEGNVSQYSIESRRIIAQGLPRDKATYIADFFENAERRAANTLNDITRKELVSVLVRDLIKKARMNLVSALSLFPEINKEDFEALLALLYLVKGASPDVGGIYAISGKRTTKELYNTVKNRLNKLKLVVQIKADPTVKDAWGFSPEIDFSLTRKGVSVLLHLVEDRKKLFDVLRARGYGEEKYIETIE